MSELQSDTGGIVAENASQGTAQEQLGTEQSEAPEQPWFSELPEELQSNAQITKYGSVEDLARGKLNADSVIGMEKMPVPSADADPEIWNDVYTKLGRPETSDQYKWKGIGDTDPDPVLTNVVAPKLHALGMLTHQQEGLNEVWNDIQSEAAAQNEAAWDDYQTEQEQQLRREWGNGFDDNKKAAQAVVRQFSDDAVADALFDDKTLGNNAGFLMFLNNVSKAMSEDKVSSTGNTGLRSAADIHKEIKDRTVADSAYMNGNDPRHKQEVQEITALYKEMEALKK